MKTAISVDDALKADATARHLGLSRGRLIADALRDYLRKRQQTRITEQLNHRHSSGLPDYVQHRSRRRTRKRRVKEG